MRRASGLLEGKAVMNLEELKEKRHDRTKKR